MVGGPGFEPEASRSRNLPRFVHGVRLEPFWTQLGPSRLPIQLFSSAQKRSNYMERLLW